MRRAAHGEYIKQIFNAGWVKSFSVFQESIHGKLLFALEAATIGTSRKLISFHRFASRRGQIYSTTRDRFTDKMALIEHDKNGIPHSCFFCHVMLGLLVKMMPRRRSRARWP
ncbi:hypothetical protein [Burkholderia perseverans]|uniref:hypothetical protein n=1 Tax=Burkholderia perseverans TaxID=2615214 RepID=UPI001FF077C5|nr:hypothetical protein [Burkholderia perseverans]